MAVPTSGELSLYKIACEVADAGGYNSTIPVSSFKTYQADPISLNNMSTGSGGFEALTPSSPSKPDGVAPHAMSEFYGYDFEGIAAGYYQAWFRDAGSTASSNEICTNYTNTYNIDSMVSPINGSTGVSNVWRKGVFDASAYIGKKVRLVIGFLHGTGDYRCDVSFSAWRISTGSIAGGDYDSLYASPLKNQQWFRYIDDSVSTTTHSANDVMQRHSSTSTSNISPSQLSSAGWSDFASSTTTPTSNHLPGSGLKIETDTNVSGHWSFEKSEQTPSANTGNEEALAWSELGSYYETYDHLSGYGAGNWWFWHYEATGSTSATIKWMRTESLVVPANANAFHFNYSASSNDQSTYYNSWIKIYVEVI